VYWKELTVLSENNSIGTIPFVLIETELALTFFVVKVSVVLLYVKSESEPRTPESLN